MPLARNINPFAPTLKKRRIQLTRVLKWPTVHPSYMSYGTCTPLIHWAAT